MTLPAVSIITVNYNGKDYLEGLLGSLHNQDYPEDKYEVIMVDNASVDDSIEYTAKNFPSVKIIRSEKNTGFAGGNNLGAANAKGELLAFINNDCMADRQWLSSLVSASMSIKNSEKSGAFGSKVLFFFKYVILDFVCDEGLIASIKKEKIKAQNSESSFLFKKAQSSIKYPDSSFKLYRDSEQNIVRQADKSFKAAIPVFDFNSDIIFDFEYFLSAAGSLKVYLEGEELFSVSSKGSNSKLFDPQNSETEFDRAEIVISKEKFMFSKYIINSMGSEINKSFYAREIGYEKIDDEDISSYKDKNENGQVKEVFALPGSSFMIKRELYDDCGLFDDKFFTYYEDIDLFWRARLKGWKAYCVPASKVRHFHCGSGQEWSRSFTYFVLRNRLIMIYKNAAFLVFLKNYAGFILAALISLAYVILARLKGKKAQRTDIGLRYRIIFEMIAIFFTKIRSRISNRQNACLGGSEIKKWIKNF